MKYFLLFSCLILFADCFQNEEKAAKETSKSTIVKKAHMFSLPDISVYRKFGFMGYPLRISKINWKNSTRISKPNNFLDSIVQQVVLDFYFNECNGDSSETHFKVKDVYINTIHYWNRIKGIYLILLTEVTQV